MAAAPAATDDFDDLYGDLYGDVDVPPPAPEPVAAASTDPRTRAAAPAAPLPIPSFTAATPGVAGLPATPQPAGGVFGLPAPVQHAPPIHYEPGYTSNNRPNVRPSDMPDEGKMFVGGLNWDTTDDALKAYFEQFGKISHCTIMRDSETQRSRGFAFLTFEDPASVNTVMSRDHYLDGKTIDPKRAIPRADGAKTDKLFVRSIPNSCTQESFRAFWRNFGAITDATLMMDKESGRHRGFGFVNYEHLESVEKVLSTGPHMMDGQVLEVKRAQAKGDNQRQQNNFGGHQNNHFGGGQQHHGGQQNQPYQPAPMAPAAGAGGAPGAFDAQAMAKFFQQMGWGAWNPLMMMQGGGGMPGMPGMPMGGGMPGMGGGMPGMGFPGMPGMGFPGMMGMDPSAGMGMYGAMGPGAIASPSGAGEFDGGQSPDGGAVAGQSQWTAPMAQPMRGGRGGGRGGRGGRDFNPPTGPASMRGGEAAADGSGAGPTRTRGGGAGFHPYSR